MDSERIIPKINRMVGKFAKFVVFTIFIIGIVILASISPYLAVAAGIVLGMLIRKLFEKEFNYIGAYLSGLDERDYVSNVKIIRRSKRE